MEAEHDSDVLRRLFDDAAMFPPAEVPLAEAAARHAELAAGPLGWMVGPLLCRASDLAALVDTAGPPAGGVGVILDTVRAPDDVTRAVRDAVELGTPAGLVQLELVLPSGTGGADVAGALVAVLHGAAARIVFVEVPPTPDGVAQVRDARDVAAAAGAAWSVAAKVRTGGATPAAVPSPAHLAGFVAACARAALPFKATAGLHHPFRHHDPVTGGPQHGFVNLLAATAAAREGADEGALTGILETEDPAVFDLTAFRMRADAAGSTGAPRRLAARELLLSIGTCSITEPASELAALGVLSGGGWAGVEA